MPACIAGSRKRRILCRKLRNWRKKMILLRPDCLVFKTSGGEYIPCSVKEVTVELMGDTLPCLDKEVIKNAASAVLHYFREEQGRTSVSLAEFSLALEQALAAL